MGSKLIKELPELVANDVITSDVATKIEAFYLAKSKGSPKRLHIIFGILGALFVGLGVILMMAHNWEHFSRTIKTVIAFLPLLIGQTLVGYSILRNKNAIWKEASGVLLFFGVGACMALISQIYNIPGELGSYLFTWICLCAPLIYLLKTKSLVVLHLCFATYYTIEVGYGFSFEFEMPWWYFSMLLWVMPYYFRSPSFSGIRTILNWLVPISLVIVLPAFLGDLYKLILPMYMLLFGGFYSLGRSSMFRNTSSLANGYLVIGSLGTVVLLLVLSFRWFWEDMVVLYELPNVALYKLFVLAGLAVYSLVYTLDKKKVYYGVDLIQLGFVLFLGLYVFGNGNDFIPMAIINVFVLLMALEIIKKGVASLHFGRLNYGLIIIAFLVGCRFFDTQMSYIVRGSLFLILGSGFFLANYIMLKRQQLINSKP